MKYRTLGLLGALAATQLAFNPAQARPNTLSFTCSGVKDFIQRRGAVVMNYKGNRVYHRFVANRTFCDREEIAKRFTVPTKDGPCTLRICREPIDKFRFN